MCVIHDVRHRQKKTHIHMLFILFQIIQYRMIHRIQKYNNEK